MEEDIQYNSVSFQSCGTEKVKRIPYAPLMVSPSYKSSRIVCKQPTVMNQQSSLTERPEHVHRATGSIAVRGLGLEPKGH